MKKHIAIILSLIMASHLSVSAQKAHKTPVKTAHYAHAKSSKKRKVHKVIDDRPEMTINDVKDMPNAWGIDVSHHQAEINWLTMVNEKPHFMFIKASEGMTILDEKYNSYYTEAKKMGIPVGSYHFFSFKSTGKEQANNFMSALQLQEGDLLPVLDAEYTRSMPKNKQKITIEITDFVNAVYEKLGLYPIIYCNYNFFLNYLDQDIQKKCKLWIANYKCKPECEWTLWQTTNKFKLNSIKGHVDLNIFYGNVESLKELFYQCKVEQAPLLDASL